MKVETFECEETKNETMEHTDEAIRLIEELGLEGQSEMIRPDKTERVPYRQMTKDEIFAYRTLCPRTTSIRQYRDEPIPLRVLQVAAHANSLGIFDELQIWHKESAAVKDPLLVATRKTVATAENGYTSQTTHILARWGEVLDEWPAVLKAAMSIWREMCREKLAEIVSEAKAAIANLETKSVAFAGSHKDGPSFYF